MNKIFRQEHKFIITTDQALAIQKRLSCFLAGDIHNAAQGYLVRSLYFDTLCDRDYHEKTDGIELRRKIRLRTYGATDASAKLEMKQKDGTRQLKRSLAISREHAAQLAQGRYACLPSYPDPFALECYTMLCEWCYRPRAIVQYRRVAFTAPESDTRITLDSSIVATESCHDLFLDKLCLSPVFSPYLTVLEVKYNGMLMSYVKDLLNTVSGSEQSTSKYCLGRLSSLGF